MHHRGCSLPAGRQGRGGSLANGVSAFYKISLKLAGYFGDIFTKV